MYCHIWLKSIFFYTVPLFYQKEITASISPTTAVKQFTSLTFVSTTISYERRKKFEFY